MTPSQEQGKTASAENQSVLEFSGDTDFESRRFEFDRGTLMKVSQCNESDVCNK